MPLRLLEIGVQAGGSLEVWSQYFEKAQLIMGCDIDEQCAQLLYEDPRIRVLIGDIKSNETLESIKHLSEEIDIIIDDGSHHAEDIIRTFMALFPRLSDHGVYIVEDLHCSYWDSYGGGLFHPRSPLTFFKKLIDITNRSAWGIPLEIEAFLSEFNHSSATSRADTDCSWFYTIGRIEFAASICMIQKSPAKENGLGALALSGDKAANEGPRHRYTKGELVVPDQRKNLFSSVNVDKKTADDGALWYAQTTRELQLELQEISTRYYETTKDLIDSRTENHDLKKNLYETTKQFYEASVRIQELEFKLAQSSSDTPNNPTSTSPDSVSRSDSKDQ